ncbi:glycosyltransferase [Sphingomonas sp. VNH70]|uniref:glycosyltransferase n=1 Tax=Sphingomonas silueang TaxID=3156617 RepID=UPI0032B40DCD
MSDQASLLLVTHVPIHVGAGRMRIDDQTAAGIAQWSRHFDRVTYYGIRTRGDAVEGSSTNWVEADGDALGGNVTVRALPWGYRPAEMLRHVRPVAGELSAAIDRHRHLCFTLGGMIGDWPSLAAWQAARKGRRYAAWIDRVEGEVIHAKVAGSRAGRLAAAALVPGMEAGLRYLLRHSSVALLQGGDTFGHFRDAAPDPHCTYDTHTHAHEAIDATALATKQARARSGAALRIVYVGRAAAMKGPFDWLAAIERLHGLGVPLHARWIGDGPDLPAMRAIVAAKGLGAVVDLPGYEGRRDVLLQAMRDADLLLFAHKSSESARCLIEALVCGCPIVGYDGGYPRGLVAAQGGGRFVPPHDAAALADAVAVLHADRGALAATIGAAAASGADFTEDRVYAHRAALMRRG